MAEQGSGMLSMGEAAPVVKAEPSGLPIELTQPVPALKDAVLASFVPIEAHMRRLAERFRGVAYDVSTPRGLADAKAARNDLREQGRYPVQRLEERLKKEANELKSVIGDEAARMIGLTMPVEAALHDQIVAEEERRERDRRQEEIRVASLKARLAGLSTWIELCRRPDMTAERIAAGIKMLEATEIGDEWAEFKLQALGEKTRVLREMEAIRLAAVEREAEQAMRDQARREVEAAAAQLAERQRELDAQAAAQAAERERVATIKARIAEIRAAGTGHENSGAVMMKEAVVALRALEINEISYGDFVEVAQLARENAIQAITARAEAKLHEVTQAIAAADQASAERARQAAIEDGKVDPITGEIASDDLAILPAAEPNPHLQAVMDLAEEMEQDVQAVAAEPRHTDEPMMNLGEISARLGFLVNREFVETKLLLPHVGRQKIAYLWRESDWPKIKAALVAHINSLP